MAKHCFIDESGTMPGQENMTVALVMLEGRRTAEHLHTKLISSIIQQPNFRGQKDMKRWYDRKKLHHYEMSNGQKLSVGKILAEADIKAIVCFSKHNTYSQSHTHRFSIYRQLVFSVVEKAFAQSKEIVVWIAKQGGWEDYGEQLLADLRGIAKTSNKQSAYRKGEFYLASPSIAGLQIADFYASSSWQYLLSQNHRAEFGAFQLIQHQIQLFTLDIPD